MPSLTERPEDIPLLCRRFLENCNAEFDKQIRGFSPAAERVLLSYAWPGNVRELENVIGRACLLADQKRIELSDLSVCRALDQRSELLWPTEWPADVFDESAMFESQPPRKRPAKKSFLGSRPAKG
jgi:DNA-binding NtrC family response regulator